MTQYNRENYYLGTTAVFKSYDAPDTAPDYISDSGSAYWYVAGGVVRRSNHWGTGCASCDWFLDDTVEQSSFAWCGGQATGFCRYEDFEPAEEYTVTVYGVPKEEVDDVDCLGAPYTVISVTPDMLSGRHVHTKYGDCLFTRYSFMSIDLR